MLRAVCFDMSGQALVTACQNGPWSEVESNPQWPCVACSRTRPVTDCYNVQCEIWYSATLSAEWKSKWMQDREREIRK